MTDDMYIIRDIYLQIIRKSDCRPIIRWWLGNTSLLSQLTELGYHFTFAETLQPSIPIRSDEFNQLISKWDLAVPSYISMYIDDDLYVLWLTAL